VVRDPSSRLGNVPATGLDVLASPLP
jgi:hypothetical protein